MVTRNVREQDRLCRVFALPEGQRNDFLVQAIPQEMLGFLTDLMRND